MNDRYEVAELSDGKYTVVDNNDPTWTLGRTVEYETAKVIADQLNIDIYAS